MHFKEKLAYLLLSGSLACLAPAFAVSADEDASSPPAWLGLSSKQKKEVLAFAEDYKDFPPQPR